MSQNPAAIILSVEGTTLSDDEKRLFASTNPLGFILFQRNCDNPDQIRALNHDLRDCVGWECPILIDQEGGRIQILNEPIWRQHIPAKSCHTVDDVRAVTASIASDLAELNIDVNCSPVMDLLCDETHDVIGDRAFSDNPQEVYEKGVVACETYLAQGITPVVKHIPGHGRATDSHVELPVVDVPLHDLENRDFEPFRRLARHPVASRTWGMLAHVVYTALDPEQAVTVSKTAMDYIRKEMGIDQFLLADHISMDALANLDKMGNRALKTVEAGCDATLYTEAILSEMQEIMEVVPSMTDKSYARFEKSRLSKQSAVA